MSYWKHIGKTLIKSIGDPVLRDFQLCIFLSLGLFFNIPETIIIFRDGSKFLINNLLFAAKVKLGVWIVATLVTGV